MLDKLWRMGILKQSREQGAGLSRVEREVTVSAFCRRRLAVWMVRSGMVETVRAVRIHVHICPSDANGLMYRPSRSSNRDMFE